MHVTLVSTLSVYNGMPKKTVTKKAAKKSAKKSSKKQNVHIVMSDALDDDTMIHVVSDADVPQSFNRMTMEKIMRQIGKKLESLDLTEDELQQIDLAALLNSMAAPPANTPEEEAQELVYSAYESSDPKKRTTLAKKALKLDPDNVDAHLILADNPATSIFGAVACYRDAVAAGERSLGKEFMEQHTGHFWGIQETRPYMRALECLAGNLHAAAAGQEECEQINLEVVEIYQKMLRLNPGDNQGIRYKLLYVLIEQWRDDEAEKLYKEYGDDESAWWLYGRALLDYRKQGDTAKSQKSLAAAIKYNKHFPPYILGIKRFPATPPGHYGVGDANEAAYYMNDSMTAWENTSGAIDWIKRTWKTS
jgi:tetratricopeptide (TPR) repeat protein